MAFRRNRMKSRRAELGLTQTQLAKLARTKQQLISLYENTTTKPSADILARIAKALHCSADWLLGLTDDPEAHLGKSDLSKHDREFLRHFHRRDAESIKEVIADWLEEKIDSDPSLAAGE